MGDSIPFVGSAAGGILGAAGGAAAQSASGAQALNQLESMYGDTKNNFAPYLDLGKQGAATLGTDLDSLISPIKMDQATLETTPGYQFNKQQGLESVQNSFAARGLADSGAAMKGAANYATGLADSTYQQQFQNAILNQNNAFTRLMGVTGVGTNSATSLGNIGAGYANSEAQIITGIGNAQAAASNTAGSSIGNAFTSAATMAMLAA